jgi:hypothetical protein
MTELHAYEVAHDEVLMQLLSKVYTCEAIIGMETEKALYAATPQSKATGFEVIDNGRSFPLEVDYTGQILQPGSSYRTTGESYRTLPEGTIFFKRKGYRHDPAQFRIMLADKDYRTANINDAKAVLTTEQLARLTAAEETLVTAKAALTAHEAKYTGWSRFFLVTSSAGHVHSSTSCSTCYITTRFALRTDLSAQSATEAIEALGETLCTVCFPEAPIAGKPKKITKAAAAKLAPAA